MGGAVALPLVVEVAFGAEPLDAGTLTWTDISDYVRRNPGVDFLRGWDTETGEPIAGRLSFTLNNDDGDFTPGETGAFGEIRNRLPIRVSAVIGTATGNALTYDEVIGWYDMLGATYDDAEIGTVVLWTGLVESWRQSWENGVRSQVQVTAVDRWAAIRRIKIDQDRLDVAARVTGRSMYYKFRDTTTTFVDSVGLGLPFQAPNGTSDLQPATVDDPTGDTNLPDVLGIDATGNNLVAVVGSDAAFSLDTGLSMTLILKASGWNDTAENVQFELRAPDGNTRAYVDLFYNGSGKLDSDARVQTPGGTALANTVRTVSQDAWQAVTLTAKRVAGTTTVKVYVNGALEASGSAATDELGATQSIHIRPDFDSTHTLAIGGVIMHPLELNAAEVDFIAQQLESWTGETADVRAGRLKNFGPITLQTVYTFTATMSKQDLADKSLADALLECAVAERGTIYIGRDGWPVLTSRSWRVASPVSFTIPATALAADVTFTLDDQQLTNSATVDRMVGAEVAGTVKATNDVSIATYGEQNKTLQVWVDTDAQLLERANAEANIDAVAQPRSSDLMVDIMSKSATISASTLLAADIGQRIAVSGMPSTAPSQDEFYIDSISDKVTASGWERTFTVSTRADYFTIADATYGQIDDVFVLAF